MKQVIQYQKSGEMYVEELPVPQLKSGGVLVKNLFSLISAGTERSSVKTAQASMVGKARSRPDLVKQVMDNAKREGWVATYKKVQSRLDNYKELGYSSAGVVVASSVDKFKVGDKVACAGAGYASHAEFIFVPQNLVAKIPGDVSFEDAAYTTVAAIALQGIRQADVRLGENVAVIGLGLLGLITIQLLKANGCRVAGLDISDKNFELAKRLGCDECFTSDFDAIQKIGSFTRSYGTDAVIITASTNSNEPAEMALEFARKKSKVVIVGSVGMNFPRSPFYEKEIDIRISCSYGPGRYDPEYEEGGKDYPLGYVRWTENRNMEAVLDLVDQNRLQIKSLTSHVFEVERALDAYDIVSGKVEEPHLGILIKYPPETSHTDTIKRITFQNANGALKSNQKPVVGFIGAGNFAQSYLIPPLQKTATKLRAVITTRPVNAKSVGEKFNFDFAATDVNELLDDPQINTVFIATRHDSHAKFVCQGLNHGKNVFVEKPLAITFEQLDEIAGIYHKANEQGNPPLVMVGFNRRFSKPLKEMKDFFAGRQEPLVMHYRVNAGFIPRDSWYQAEDQNGRIIGEACHFIDTMQYLSGSLPAQVSAMGPADTAGKYCADNMIITISFADGSVGSVSYLANGGKTLGKEHFEANSEGKTAIMDNFKSLTLYEERKKTAKKYSGAKGHSEEVEAVIDALTQGKPSPIAFESLYYTTKATFAAIDSFRQNGQVILL